jgi:hypothetical protein
MIFYHLRNMAVRVHVFYPCIDLDIKNAHTCHVELSLSQSLDIFKLLTHTYPRYVDSGSREAVEEVGMIIIRRDETSPDTKMGVTEQILGWLNNEIGRIARKGSGPATYASTDLFVLLSWCCGIYEVCTKSAEDFPAARAWPILVGLIATLSDLLLSPASRTKPAIQKTTIVRTRRALRSVCAPMPCHCSL